MRTLHRRTLWILAVTLLGLLVVLCVVSWKLLQKRFEWLEEQETQEGIRHLVAMTADELAGLSAISARWASCDEVYQFFGNRNPEILRGKLGDANAADLGFHLIVLVSNDRQIVYSKGFPGSEQHLASVSEALLRLMTTEPSLLGDPPGERPRSGVVLLPEGALLEATHPVRVSQRDGASRGFVLVGRFADATMMERWSARLHLPLQMYRADDTQLPVDVQMAKAMLATGKGAYVHRLNAREIAGYTVWDDWRGNPALLVRTLLSRHIYAHGMISLRYLFFLLLGISMFGGVMVFVFAKKIVLSRVRDLANEALEVGSSGDPARTLTVTGHDEVARLGGTINDILASRRKSVEQWEERGRMLGTLMSNLQGLVYRCVNDRERTMEFVSEGCSALIGYIPSELVGDAKVSFGDLIHLDDREAVWNAVQAALQEKRRYHLFYRIRSSTGREKWVSDRGQGVYGSSGELLALEGFVADITDRKRTEDELRVSEERFRSLSACSPVGIALMDAMGRCTYSNPRFRTIFGVTLTESDAHGWARHVLAEDNLHLLKDWESCARRHHEFSREVRARTASGAIRWVQMRSSSMLSERMDFTGYVLTAEDITERKQAEADLRLQSAALESAANGIVITDQHGVITWVNHAFTELTGYSRVEMIGENPRLLKSGQHSAAFYRNLWETITSGNVWRGELINKRKDGTHYTEDMTITPVCDDRGIITHFVAIKQDVTLRTQMEQDLAQERNLLRTLLDSHSDYIYIKDRACRYVVNNKAHLKILHAKSQEEVVGKGDFDVFPREMAQQYYDDDQELMRTGTPLLNREEVTLGVDGNLQFVLTTKMPLRDAKGNITGLVGVSRDITLRKKMQERLLQTQKMEAVGYLAGGVAHDFNNILTAIMGFDSLLLRGLDAHNPLHGYAEEVYKAAHRAAALTRQLLAFSRKQVLQPKVLNINGVVTDLQKMLRLLLGDNIRLVPILGQNLGNVLVDESQLEQAIINLVVNARDAMPQGGNLTIETSNYHVVPGHFAASGTCRDYVMLTIRDTGVGMSDEVKEHLFEPFFTTKGPGKGTGMGLATCYGFVQQSGGHIEAESRLGQGTAFHIYLPRVTENVQEPEPVPSSEALPRGTETILLVEDEPAVRELAGLVLRELGYTVLEAGNGVEALKLLLDRGSPPIDLLLTDVMMPEMDGAELTRQLRERFPEIKVIFSSGYTDDAISRHGILEPGVAFIQKPSTPATLARRVREVLDKGTQNN